MGSKNKLKKFQENNTFKNVIQPHIKEIIKENKNVNPSWFGLPILISKHLKRDKIVEIYLSVE